MQKKRLLAVIVMLVGIATAIAQDDNELRFDETVTSTLAADTTDEWIFVGNQNDLIQIEIDSQEAIPEITIRDAEDNIQARSQSDVSLFRIPQFGTYTLEVRADIALTYDLTLTQVEAGAFGVNQGEITFGETVTQEITDELPFQFWVFEGLAGQVVDIRMRRLEGDLEPVVALITPLDDLIEEDAGEAEANLLAVRLPNDGFYTIRVQREGGELGFTGDTSGIYALELVLRNEDVAASALTNLSGIGRITPEAPLTAFSISQRDLFAVEVVASEANCLLDVAVRGQNRFRPLHQTAGISPLRFTVDLTEAVQHLFEITSPTCGTTLDVAINLTPLEQPEPLRYLDHQEEMYLQMDSAWYFAAQAGDIVRLRIDSLTDVTTTRLLDPIGNDLYEAEISTALDELFFLQDDGLYYLEVDGTEYQLQRDWIGSDNIPFEVQVPIEQAVLDIDVPQSWSIRLETTAEARLIVQNPDGSILDVATGDALTPPHFEQIGFAQPGRYNILVFSDAEPDDIVLEKIADRSFIATPGMKATLNGRLTAHRWALTATADVAFDLALQPINTFGERPSLIILDPNGAILPPEDNGRYRPTISGEHTIFVSNTTAISEVTYQLVLDSPDAAPQTSIAAVTQSAPDSFTNNNPTPRAPIVPSYDETPAFDQAQRVSVPSTVRSEITADEFREILSISAFQGQYLALNATSLDGQSAPGMTLFDENLNIVLEKWERDSSVNEIRYRVPDSGIYYIGITLAGGGRYELLLDNQGNIDETLPEVENAAPLKIGRPILAELNSRSESDTYFFWGNAGSEIGVRLIEVIGNISPDVTIITPSGAELTDETLNLRETGLYRVRVDAESAGRSESFSRYHLVIGLISGQSTDSGLLEDTAMGRLAIGDTNDVWFFEAHAGERVTVQVSPIDANGPTPLEIALADTAGNVFYSQEAPLSVNTVGARDIMLPKGGIYLIRVEGGTDVIGDYAISLERDRSYLTGGVHPIAYGDTTSGVFEPGNIVDEWILSGNRGDQVAIALRPSLGSSASVGFQIELPDGTVVGTGIDAGLGAGARTEAIELPQTGQYLIRVGVPDPDFDDVMAYELSVELQNRAAARSAGGILDGVSSVAGTIFADDVRDTWLLEGQAGDIIRVEMRGDGILEPMFSVITPDAEVIDGIPQPELSRAGTLEEPARLIEFTLPETGVYIVDASNVNGTTGQYELLVSVLTRDAPRLLERGETYESTIRDEQIWEFSGAAGDSIDLTVLPLQRSRVAPAIVLISPDGRVLLREDTTIDQAIDLEYTLPQGGTYEILVSGATLLDEISSGRYEIELNIDSATDTTTIRPLNFDEGGLGLLDSDNDFDVWGFQGQAGDVVSIIGLQTSGNLDPLLTLRTPGGEMLQIADDNPGGTNAFLQAKLPESGRYTVEIARFDGELGNTEGNYLLEISRIYQPAAEVIPDDLRLSYGQQQIATLEDEATQTWYFVGSSADVVSLNLQFSPDTQPLFITLADGAGNIYLQSERIQDRAVIDNFVLPADGIYQIMVGVAQGSRTAAFYPYTLTVTLESSAPTTFSSGGTLMLDEPQNARFDDGRTQHTWLYAGHADETIQLTLLRLAGTQLPDVAIVSPNGEAVLNATNLGEAAYITETLPVDGLYQIVTSATDPLSSYRILITTGRTAVTEETLLLDTTVTGEVGNAIPEQRWTIAGGQTITARLLASDVTLKLEAPSGAIIAMGMQADGQLVLPGVTLPSDEDYHLVVSRTEARTVPYQLRVSSQTTLPEMLLAEPLDNPQMGFLDGSSTDYYSFFATANTPLAFDIEAIDGISMPTLQIMRQNGELIEELTPPVVNLLLQETDFYIVAVTNPTPLSYRIRYDGRQSIQADSTPRETTRRINLQGELSPNLSYELWAIPAEAGEVLNLEIDALFSNLQADLVLISPSGRPVAGLVAEADENRPVLGPILITETGQYVLRVSNWLEHDQSYDYTLRILEGSLADELIVQNAEIVRFNQPVRGGVTTNSNMWTFRARADSRFNFRLSDGETTNLRFRLFAPNGALVDLQTTQQGAGTLAFEDVLLEQSGRYTIAIDTPGDSNLTLYSLLITEQNNPLAVPTDTEFIQESVTFQAAQRAFQFVGAANQNIRIDVRGIAQQTAHILLITPDDTLLLEDADGLIESVWLPQTGDYSLIITTSADVPYTATITQQALRNTQPDVLQVGQSVDADSGLHEWILQDYVPGTYTVRASGTEISILDTSQQVIAIGTDTISAYLDGATYNLLANSNHGEISVHFDVGLNLGSPAPIIPNQPNVGRLTDTDGVDEWFFEAEANQDLVFEVDGDTCDVVLYGPGNIFLEEFSSVERIEAISPVEGRYVLQVSGQSCGLYSLRYFVG